MKSLVFLFIIVNSLIFTFVVPPFQKPDEDTHFYRTVALSEGQFFCSLNNKGEKVMSIPKKYYDLPGLFLTEDMKFNYLRKFSVNIPDLKKFLAGENSGNIETNKACISYFIGFIPNTIGFLLATPVNNPIIQFYFGRIAGLVFFLLCFWYALRIIPRPFHIILYLYGILPMVLHQITSYSYDVLLLSMVPLVFGFLVKVYAEKIITMKIYLLYQFSVFFLVLSKPISFPFIFLHLLFPFSKISGKRNTFLILNIIFFISAVFINLFFLRA